MIGHLLNRELTVYRPAAVSDGAGGRTRTFSEVGPIKVQVNQPSTEEKAVAQQFGAILSHVLHALNNSDVRRGDELDGDLPSDVPAGRRLRVFSVVANSRDTYKRIGCEITQAEGDA